LSPRTHLSASPRSLVRSPSHLLWDGTSTEPLSGVDNVTVAAGSGDIFVAEDGANMELVLITPEGEVVPFARVVEPGHEGSEVTGPFRGAGATAATTTTSTPAPSPSTTLAQAAAGETDGDSGRDLAPVLGVAVALGAAGAGAAWWLRSRRPDGAASD
jgi:hypothetical protein